MNSTSRPFSLGTSWLVILALLGMAFPLAAQEDRPDPPAESETVPRDSVPQETVPQETVPQSESQPPITVASVEEELAKLEADAGIEEGLRTLYEKAIADLKTAEENTKIADVYRSKLQSGPAETEQRRAELERTPVIEALDAGRISGTLDELRAARDAKNRDLTELTASLSQTRQELSAARERVNLIAPEMTANEANRVKLGPELETALQADVGSSPLRKAERIEKQAKEIMLASERDKLQQEQASQSIREALSIATRDLLSRQIENARTELVVLQAAVNSRWMEIAQEDLQAPAGLPMDDPDVADLWEEIQPLRQEFRDAVKIGIDVEKAEREVTARLNELETEKTELGEQLDLGGAGEVLSQLLFHLESQIVDPENAAGELLSDVPSIDQTRIAAIRVDRRSRQMPRLREQFADAPPSVHEALDIRQRELGYLKNMYDDVWAKMFRLNQHREELVREAEGLRKLIKNRLFWLRTVPPVSAQTFTEAPAGLAWLVRPEHWQEFWTALVDGFEATPLLSIVVLLLSVGLLLVRPWILAALTETGVKARRISTDRYRWTWEALGWTILFAIPVPLLFGFTGWKLVVVPGASDWLRGLSYGLQSASWVVLDLALVAAVVRPGGLGEAHFRWKNVPQKRIRLAAWAFGLVYVPAAILTSSTLFSTTTQNAASIGRLAFIAAQIWTGLVVWWLFSSSEGILARWNRANPGEERSRLRSFWFALLLACPLLLAALSWAGYLIMAIELFFGFASSLATVACGVLVYWMFLRWFFIKTRSLALAEAMEKRQARLAAAEADEGETSEEIVTVDAEDDGSMDLGSISAQTRHIIRMLISVVVAVVLVAFWSGMFPLIEELKKVPFVGNLSVLDAGLAILIFLISSIVIRNLPGLLELTILRQQSIDSGTRYAIVRLAQYFLIAVALGLLFHVLKVDWSQFGWIAAALSVGLGFGLQEVVANFICGIILLFERPIRVGDVVTLENVTGTVTRIHMRSTTITNWDRQDFVVPNKNLITGTILNWTLSGSVNRIVIPVGVAYGTDTDEARQILLDVATEHPLIVDEPAPMATFDEFADSSLLITLRAYLPDMDNRLKTITELHTEIDKRFAAAGVEIAFPQLDMHLRPGKETASQPFATDLTVDA